MIVKLSYSILNAWATGHQEDAVGMYLGKGLAATPAMELGKLKHSIWERYIKENGSLPEELGGGGLVSPVSEQKYEKSIPLGKYTILLRGIIDCTDGNKLIDFKCGLGTPTSYVDTMQLDYYKILYPEAIEGIYLCFNPYNDTYTKGVKFLSQQNAENALEHIITYGGEMIDYLASQKLLVDYVN